jgi:two-component system, NtrC family, C4-dicarboxylate transport sensor histidine kinase DctB
MSSLSARARGILAVISMILLALCVRQGTLEYGVRGVALQSAERLRLIGATLETRIERFRFLPEVVARSREIEELFANRSEKRNLDVANTLLARINAVSGALALYVTDTTGLTIAASNFDSPGSFVGQNYAFRPYFQGAVNGERGSYYAVGATTGQPGYFLAVPIRVESRVVGVAIVKIDLLPLEQQWRDAGELITVQDSENIIFLASRPQWRYLPTAAISSEVRNRLVLEQRYKVPTTGEPPWRTSDFQWSGQKIAVFSDAVPGGDRLITSMPFPEGGWTLTYLAPLASLTTQANIATLAAILACLLAMAAWEIARQRRRARFVARMTVVELEARVGERTQALTEANRRLEAEIAERRHAEEELDVTRSNLTQAAKLATMGQAFAGFAHEISQPLAALRTYLSSTNLLARRGDGKGVETNVELMVQLVDRLSNLTMQLKGLARRGSGDFVPVDLTLAVRRVLDLMKFRFSEQRIVVDEALEAEMTILGDSAQIEQVVLNLLTNAMDSVAALPEPKIQISSRRVGAFYLLSVHDNGAGIDAQIAEKIFEPFYTTKGQGGGTQGQGSGLGLGLSTVHRIVADHHGTITCGHSHLGGAVFTMRLHCHDAQLARTG